MNEQGEPAIRVQVDVTNPGQFFACCGLLELAARLAKGSTESWFESGRFCLRGSTSVPDLLRTLAAIEPALLKEPIPGVHVEEKIAPLQLPLAGSSQLVIDAWTKFEIKKRKLSLQADSSWKFWSGNQGVLSIWRDLRDQLSEQLKTADFAGDCGLFANRQFMTGRFGFDAQAAWNALDSGYSPNDQSQPVATSPALEMLALVGLQRFRPAVLEDFQFEYSTWGDSLEPVAAKVAVCGLLAIPPTTRLRAKIVRRGKYGGLSYATKLSGDNV